MANKENSPSLKSLLQAYKELHITSPRTLQDSELDKETEQLLSQARVYLSSVTYHEKFPIVQFKEITSEALKNDMHSSAKTFDDIQSGYRNLEKFGINLMRYPWRREFYSVKLYTCFYKHNIESKVPFGPAVLALYGYRPKSNQLMVLQEPLDLIQITRVAFELFLAGVEVKVLSAIAREVDDYSPSMLRDILKARLRTVGDESRVIKSLEKYRDLYTSHKRIKLDRDSKQEYAAQGDDDRTDSISHHRQNDGRTERNDGKSDSISHDRRNDYRTKRNDGKSESITHDQQNDARTERNDEKSESITHDRQNERYVRTERNDGKSDSNHDRQHDVRTERYDGKSDSNTHDWRNDTRTERNDGKSDSIHDRQHDVRTERNDGNSDSNSRERQNERYARTELNDGKSTGRKEDHYSSDSKRYRYDKGVRDRRDQPRDSNAERDYVTLSQHSSRHDSSYDVLPTRDDMSKSSDKTSKDLRYPPGMGPYPTGYDTTHLHPEVTTSKPSDTASTIVADSMTDYELYGEMNGHRNSPALVNKQAQLRMHSPGIHRQQVPGLVGNLSQSQFSSTRGIPGREADSDYENMWDCRTVPFETSRSAPATRSNSKPPHPPQGVPPPDYSDQGYATPEQQLDEEWVMIKEGVSGIHLDASTHQYRAKGYTGGRVGREVGREVGMEGSHPGVAVKVNIKETPHVDYASRVRPTSDSGIQSTLKSTGSTRSFSDVVQSQSTYQTVPGNMQPQSEPQYHNSTIQLPASSSVLPQRSKIEELFPKLPSTVPSESSRRSVRVSAGNIPVNAARVTRSGRTYPSPPHDEDERRGGRTYSSPPHDEDERRGGRTYPSPQYDEDERRGGEESRTEVAASSGDQYTSATGNGLHSMKTCVCKKQATKVCEGCAELCCDEHAAFLANTCCTAIKNHVFVKRRETGYTASTYTPIPRDKSEQRPVNTQTTNPRYDIQKQQASSEKGTTKCEFCNMSGRFNLMCEKCLKICCKSCLVYFDSDLCEEDKGAHHFKDLSGNDHTKEPWTCERCTFLNPPEHGICTICGTTRGVKGPEFPTSGSRKCHHCTFGNAEGDKVCKACHKTMDPDIPESYI